MPGKIVTVAIHKGGTGKTTAAVNLAHLAREQHHKTLLVDLDTQGNATDNFIKNVPQGILTASKLFAGKPELPVLNSNDGLDIVPADGALLAVERYPFETAEVFKEQVRELSKAYDVVIIDTPPTMGFAMLAPLVSSDFAFAPIIPDAYGVKGVKSLLMRVADIQRKHNPDLKFIGLLINQWDRRNRAQNQVVEVLKNKLAGRLIPHAIGIHAAVGYSVHNQVAVWHNATSGAHRVAGRVFKTAMEWILGRLELSSPENHN